eukprot:m.236554 g.236554  ORF g.236554 m.236554 type:complete len:404 (-) comp33687_c2_seq2:215-1426(-)
MTTFLRSVAAAVVSIPGVRTVIRAFAEPIDDERVLLAATDATLQLPLAMHGSGLPSELVSRASLFVFDNAKQEWVACQATAEHGLDMNMIGNKSPPPTTLSVLTFNVMMDVFEKYSPGVIQSNVRYPFIADTLASSDHHLISLNEVDEGMLSVLTNHPGIRATFAISAKPGELQTFRARGFGNVVLVRRDCGLGVKQVLVIKSARTHARASLVCDVVIGHACVSFVSVHLDARCSLAHFENRRHQLYELYKLFSLNATPGSENGRLTAHPPTPSGVAVVHTDQTLIVGDFNFHQEAETALIETAQHYTDVCVALTAHSPTPLAPTWSGVRNVLTNNMWLGCDQREMRLDRVVLGGCAIKGGTPLPLSPITIGVVFDDPLPHAKHLCASDHFGLVTTFKIGVEA